MRGSHAFVGALAKAGALAAGAFDIHVQVVVPDTQIYTVC